MRRWGWVLLALALVSTAIFGCSPSSDTGPPPVEEVKPTDPDNLMLFLARAYREEDPDDYDQALDESFLFQFTPDIADELGLPELEPWWGKTEDLGSTRGMFDEPTVTAITFTYETVGEWIPHIEVRKDTTFSGVFRRYDPLIEVITVTDNPEDPELRYRVDGSWLDIIAVPDRFTEGNWTILKIQEVEKNPTS
ncbi:hypothetical protein ACFL2Z_05275 [Candidatus Eisenbacteria bacterium]|uniref:Uncharacterized protein n=1 Tax=Eiseniibacteriota bacterium TaxID=2212470 RepID=A0ABV6YQG1_UNCEI